MLNKYLLSIFFSITSCLLIIAPTLSVPVPNEDFPSGLVYYVDSVNGNDGADGKTEHTAWRTLRHAAETMESGDTCYIRAGTYREEVHPKDGQSFVAYKSEKPVVTGTELVTDWTLHVGSIYKAPVSSKVLDVFVGNAYMQKARYPNEDEDPLTIKEWAETTTSRLSRAGRGTGKTKFLNGMNQPPNYWVGGWYSGVNGDNPFMASEGRIIASSGDEITATELSPAWKGVYGNGVGEGRGYITDHLNCLDAAKEWHWQDGTLYFWAPGNGAPINVEARTRIYGFVITDRTNVTLKGLYFKGASVQIAGGRGVTIDGCHFRYVSPWGTHYYPDARLYNWGGTVDGTSGIHISGSDHTIKNSSVVGGWGHGIHLSGGTNLTVNNNYIADFGWAGRFVASPVSGFGTGLNIRNNTIRRSSGPGIFLYQKNPGDGSNVNHVKQPFILHNDIRDIGYMLSDSGSAFIYLQNADVPSAERALNGEIAYNILIRSFNGPEKVLTGGIYLDNGTDFCSIHHNVIDMQYTGDKTLSAIFLHASGHNQENISVTHNVLWGYASLKPGMPGGVTILTNVKKGGRQTNVTIQNNVMQHAAVWVKDYPTSNKGAGITQSNNRPLVAATEFVDAAQGDFRLKSGSDSIDRGIIIPGINDAASPSPFTGTAPDLGAYEFNGANWSAGSSVKPPEFP